MTVKFHSHALLRLLERGTTEAEITATVMDGEKFPAKFNRIGFRRNFRYENEWQNRWYENKQLEVYAVEEKDSFLVIAVIVKYF